MGETIVKIVRNIQPNYRYGQNKNGDYYLHVLECRDNEKVNIFTQKPYELNFELDHKYSFENMKWTDKYKNWCVEYNQQMNVKDLGAEAPIMMNVERGQIDVNNMIKKPQQIVPGLPNYYNMDNEELLACLKTERIGAIHGHLENMLESRRICKRIDALTDALNKWTACYKK